MSMSKWIGALLALVVLGGSVSAQASVPDEDVVFVWESGGMSQATLVRIMRIVEDNGLSVSQNHRGTLQLVSVTRGDETIQAAPAGFVIPMAALAIDPQASLRLIGSEVAGALQAGTVVMGESSAKLRGAQVGDVVTFVGWDARTVSLPIGAIAPDERVQSNELVFSVETARSFGFVRLSSVNLWGFEDKDALFRQLVVEFVDESVGVDDDPARKADDVLTTVALKRQFGEFAYRFTGPGDRIQIDPAWVEANIVTVNLPLLGLFKCHRSMVPYLEHAIDDVVAAGLSGEINRADFQLAGGCYNPRLIRGGDKGGAISRHSWGIAVDINPSENPYGGVIAMDQRVADIFHNWGFAWGGGWVYSDGAHFEWTRLPDAIVDT